MQGVSLEKLFARHELHPAARMKFERDAGWRYGLLFGSVLVLIGWGIDASEQAAASVELWWLKLVLLSLVIIPMTLLAGALAGRALGSARRFIVWILFGGVIGGVGLLLSFVGVSLIAQVLDPALHGIIVFPFAPTIQERVPLITVVGMIIGFFAAVLQGFATTWAWEMSSSDNRFTRQGWAAFLICVPLALLLGALFDGTVNAQMRGPTTLSQRIIHLALTTPPDADIHQMDLMTMLDYVATQSWRANFAPRFVQHIADFDRQNFRTVYLDIEFENGFIWRCKSVRNGDDLTDCVDLRAQYSDLLRQFFKTGAVQCQNCLVSIAPAATAWHVQSANILGEPQQVSLSHHFGGVVVMQAALPAGTVECRFVGAEPVVIQDCARR